MRFREWLLSEVTQTDAFRRWFNKSAVVDQNGDPLVVYKGMYPYTWVSDPNNKRDPGKPGPEITSINRGSEFPSFHKDEPGVKLAGFFGDKDTASRFATSVALSGGAVFPVYLSLQNPYVVDATGRKSAHIQFGESGKPFRDALRSGKYDGAIIRNTDDEGTVYVALRPTQIKSAISNQTFDPNNPHINH